MTSHHTEISLFLNTWFHECKVGLCIELLLKMIILMDRLGGAREKRVPEETDLCKSEEKPSGADQIHTEEQEPGGSVRGTGVDSHRHPE